MRRPLRHILLHLALMVPVAALAAALVGTAPVSAQTATWVKYATVSPTTTLTAGSLCYSDGRDIACDGNAATFGGLAVDRITSGTAGVYVSSTGVINFRTGGVTTGYFDTAGLLVAPGISLTSAYGISSTMGYFSGSVGIGRVTSPLAPLHIEGNNGNYTPDLIISGKDGDHAVMQLRSSGTTPWSLLDMVRVIDNSSAGSGNNMMLFETFRGSGTNINDMTYSNMQSGDIIGQIHFRGSRYGSNNSSNVGLISLATTDGQETNMSVHVKPLSFTGGFTGRLPLLTLNSSQTVGILVASPTTSLEVSGTVSATTLATSGTLKVSGTAYATAFVGNGSGLTGLSAGDRITSGTAGVYVSDTGVINFRTGGVTTGYFDTAGTLLAPGVSVTGVNGISSTIGYFSSNLSVRGRADVGTPSTYNVLVGPATGLANTGSYNVNVGYISGGGGSVSYVTSIGTYSAQSNSASYLVAVGTSAGQYNTGNYATLINGGQFNKGSYVTSIGIGSASSNSGTYLSALGMSAGARNAGNSVVAVGYNAAGDNTGSNVTAVGVSAAASNTFDNVTALGYRATSDKANQVILGNSSVVEVTTTGVILAAGVSTTGTISATRFVGDGSGLTGLGTGDRITSGTAGVYVSTTGVINFRTGGVTTGYFDTAGLLVGPGISLTSGYGISSTNGYFSGNVGIGTATPSATAALTVNGDIYLQPNGGTNRVINFGSSYGRAALYLYDGGAGKWGLGLNSGEMQFFATGSAADHFSWNKGGSFQPSGTNELMRLMTASGSLGIGTSSPTAKLEVVGVVSSTGVQVTGDISYTGVLTDTSDRRLKTKIAMMDGHMLERLMLMQPVSFEMKDRPGLTEYGFIAQDVKQIFPDLVFTANDASKTMSMNYVGLIAPMVQGMQELRQENQSLKAKTDALEGRLERLERLLLESKAAVKH